MTQTVIPQFVHFDNGSFNLNHIVQFRELGGIWEVVLTSGEVVTIPTVAAVQILEALGRNPDREA